MSGSIKKRNNFPIFQGERLSKKSVYVLGSRWNDFGIIAGVLFPCYLKRGAFSLSRYSILVYFSSKRSKDERMCPFGLMLAWEGQRYHSHPIFVLRQIQKCYFNYLILEIFLWISKIYYVMQMDVMTFWQPWVNQEMLRSWLVPEKVVGIDMVKVMREVFPLVT